MGRYRIVASADDGVRVQVSGDLVINAWKTQPPTTYTAFLEHCGGAVDVEVEYYQAWGGAELSLELTLDGFIGEYYLGIQLDKPADPGYADWARNPPHAYRFETSIDFDWGGTGRLARVGSDRFSARWWDSVELPVGRWVDQSATTREAIVDLAGARREVRVKYYERTGNAICKLELERLLQSAAKCGVHTYVHDVAGIPKA